MSRSRYHLFVSSLSSTNKSLKPSSSYSGVAASGDGTLSTSSCFSPLTQLRPSQVFGKSIAFVPAYWNQSSPLLAYHLFNSSHHLRICGNVLASVQLPSTSNNYCTDSVSSSGPKKRKKLKGKRAVVKWLKFFRWKKKKEFEKMTQEEKLLHKLNLARKKEERLVTALKKIEPELPGETTHDPEILTPEEHFFFLKMGINSKNIVPVGRRGVYQGVILNMHLHWKKHQTLKVVVRTFTPEEVKEIAADLSRLTGGIVLHIDDKRTIIMYRGKNYTQPPPEIMSPRVSLPRMKAVRKSKHRDALRAVRLYIPKLERNISLLGVKLNTTIHKIRGIKSEKGGAGAPKTTQKRQHQEHQKPTKKQRNLAKKDKNTLSNSDPSESDFIPDIVDAELVRQEEEEEELPLYLNEFDKLTAREVTGSILDGDCEIPPGFDEVDKLFLRSITLLSRRRRLRRYTAPVSALHL